MTYTEVCNPTTPKNEKTLGFWQGAFFLKKEKEAKKES